MHPESTLNQLKAALPSGQLPSSYGVYFKNTLVALCHALEDHILQTCPRSPADKPLVLATFQRGKFYLQEADRYRDIAACSNRVVIAALPDSGFSGHQTGQLDNVSLIHLKDEDDWVNEWNLIIFAPGYAAMVLCYELSDDEYRGDSPPETDMERKFYGLWTFDRKLVAETVKIFSQQVATYDASLSAQIAQRHQQIAANLDPNPSDLSPVVNRIVNYLQSSQERLITVGRQTREFWELEGQALRLNRNLTANRLNAFMRMAQRIDERDTANPVASLQVSALSETIGQLLDLPTLKLRRLRLAGLLFRVGLAEAPASVFTQLASKLDNSTRQIWRDREVLGAQLLDAMPELQPIAHIILHQREHWDGSGRPNGLHGDDIPIESRILGLVAHFQELTQTRSDRRALEPKVALAKCQQYKGIRYDPTIVEMLQNVVNLVEMGLMQLPNRPSQLPPVWLEESNKSSLAKTEATS